nr:hypothetical protein [Candidatus Liberibacter asiaticus]
MIWRELAVGSTVMEPGIIAEKLLERMRKRNISGLPAGELLEMVERIYLDVNRRFVRSMATRSSRLIAAA